MTAPESQPSTQEQEPSPNNQTEKMILDRIEYLQGLAAIARAGEQTSHEDSTTHTFTVEEGVTVTLDTPDNLEDTSYARVAFAGNDGELGEVYDLTQYPDRRVTVSTIDADGNESPVEPERVGLLFDYFESKANEKEQDQTNKTDRGRGEQRGSVDLSWLSPNKDPDWKRQHPNKRHVIVDRRP